MRSETDCPKFIYNTIKAYTSGEGCPFYEAVDDGVEPELKSVTQGESQDKWKHQSQFSLVSGSGDIMIPVNMTLEASKHWNTIASIVHDIPCKVATVNGDHITMTWDAPKINDAWGQIAELELNKHATIFKLIRPYGGVLSYLGTIINKVFFLGASSDHAAYYLHLVHKYAHSNNYDTVRYWSISDTKTFIALSLNAPNAGWFDIETLPLAKPKDLIREMYLKVLKRRTKYTLNQLYANAEAQGLLK
jgi:hypothetical protein